MPSRSQTPTVLSEHMVWQRTPVGMQALLAWLAEAVNYHVRLPSDLTAHSVLDTKHVAILPARSSRPLPQHQSKLICATYTESLIRRVANKAVLRPVVVCTGLSHGFASVTQLAIYLWYSRCSGCVSRKAYLGGGCRSGVSFRRTEGRTLLSLKQTLGDLRIPPNSCTPLTSCKLAIFSLFLESFQTRAVSDNA